MKLITGEVRKAFEKYPLYSQDGKGKDAIVVAKFFDPSGRYTFFATEGSEEDGDFRLFGYCISMFDQSDDEFGYASANELQTTKNRFGLGIERDRFFKAGQTVREAVNKHYGRQVL